MDRPRVENDGDTFSVESFKGSVLKQARTVYITASNDGCIYTNAAKEETGMLQALFPTKRIQRLSHFHGLSAAEVDAITESSSSLAKVILRASRKKPPDTGDTLCLQKACNFKHLKNAPWIRCEFSIDGEGERPCDYWMHAVCIGFATASDQDIAKMPPFYCPTHMQVMAFLERRS